MALCHDQGYIPFLEQLAQDERVRNSITLIRGARVARQYRTLNLGPRIELSTVFSPDEGTLLWRKIKNTFHHEDQDMEEVEIWWQRKFYQRTGSQDPSAIQISLAEMEAWAKRRLEYEQMHQGTFKDKRHEPDGSTGDKPTMTMDGRRLGDFH